MAENLDVIKMELVFSVVVFAVWAYTFIEVLLTPEAAMRNLPKVAWVIVVFLLPLLGTVAWWVLGRPERQLPRTAGAYERTMPTFPEYDRPGRAAATDPEKDEAFLRQIRKRAEAQRKEYDVKRKQERQRETEGDEP